MTAEGEKTGITNRPEGDKLSGDANRAQSDEFEREMQREIDRTRRLLNEALSALERKLKNRHAS